MRCRTLIYQQKNVNTSEIYQLQTLRTMRGLSKLFGSPIKRRGLPMRGSHTQLLLNNYPDQVKVVFLPPNITFIVQALDQGVVPIFIFNIQAIC